MIQLMTLVSSRMNVALSRAGARATKGVIRTQTISQISCPLDKDLLPSHNLTMTAMIDGIAFLEMHYIYPLCMRIQCPPSMSGVYFPTTLTLGLIM